MLPSNSTTMSMKNLQKITSRDHFAPHIPERQNDRRPSPYRGNIVVLHGRGQIFCVARHFQIFQFLREIAFQLLDCGGVPELNCIVIVCLQAGKECICIQLTDKFSEGRRNNFISEIGNHCSRSWTCLHKSVKKEHIFARMNGIMIGQTFSINSTKDISPQIALDHCY